MVTAGGVMYSASAALLKLPSSATFKNVSNCVLYIIAVCPPIAFFTYFTFILGEKVWFVNRYGVKIAGNLCENSALLHHTAAAEHLRHFHAAQCCINGLHLCGRKADVGSTGVFLQACSLAGSGNRHNIRLLA